VLFQVLGPFEAVVDGHAVPLGGARQRLVLAALAARANSVVSSDRLIDILWGDAPPVSALSTLQKYVYRLRSAVGADRLVTRAPGYLLRIGDGESDALRFESLLADGSRLAAAGELAEAHRTFDAALALWRGRAWGEFADFDFARGEVARLDGLRAAAIDDRTEVALAAGRPAEVIGELEAIVSEYPLRERPRGQLMLALYRAGRQADALRAYEAFRRYLGEEVGLEPSAQLVQLADAIVLQKPELETHASSLSDRFPEPSTGTPPGRGAPPLPTLLAADTEPFVGRSTELEWLDVLWQRAAGGERVTAAVYGPRGIGKSRLLAEFARRVHAAGGTVAYHSGALAALDVASVPTLAVLDDSDDPNLDGLAPDSSRVLIVALCRQRPHAVPGARELGGLDATDVCELLTLSLEGVSSKLGDAVWAETTGNPALVRDVAARLRERDTAERAQRALSRIGDATREVRSLRDDVVAGVLERGRIAPGVHDPAMLGVCPYKGLARYEAADAPFFFGRERLVALLVARLAADRFVGVIGASGSGKSSLVRAGLVPAVAAGALPGSGAWPTCTFTPGEHPLRSFAEALAPSAGIPGPELARRLDRQPDELGAVLEAVVRGREGARLVVVVDQFEEVATLCRDQAERERFAAAMVDAVTDPSVPAVVVPVVRADYHRALTVHPELARLFEQSQLLVGAMSDADLRRAITEPARRAGLVLDDGLVDAVCADAGTEPGALPLVSTAMAETWVRRDDGVTLTLAGYRDAGGVHGALARLADGVYGGLDPGGQTHARRLFLRLAEPGEGNDDVRRRMPRGEVGGDADAVLDAFVGRRLLIADSETVEVAHEALLRDWPRLRGWLEEDRAGRRLHRQFTLAAASWDGEGRDPGALYRGTRLDAALEWAGTHADDVNAVEHEFLDASVDAQHGELRRARRTARRLRSLAGAMAVFLAVALVAGGVALVQRSHATRQARRARAAAVSAEVDRVVASMGRILGRDRAEAGLLAAAAERLRPGPDTRGALLSALEDEPRLLSTISGGPDGTAPGGLAVLWNGTLAYGGADGVGDIVDLSNHKIVRGFDVPNATAMAATSDGRLLAAGTQDGTVVFWDPVHRARVGASLHYGAPVDGMAFSPDGRTLALTFGRVRTVDPVTAINTARLVNVASGRTTSPLGGHPSTDESVAFTPDGKDVITGGTDGLVVTHDATTGSTVGRPIDFHRGEGASRLAVSPDGRYLVVMGDTLQHSGDVSQPVATVYDRVTGAVITTLTGDEYYGDVGFDRHGQHLVVEGQDGVQVYNVPSFTKDGAEILSEHGPGDAVFLGSGLLAVAGADGTITLWDPDATVASGRAVPGSPSHGGAFSPDGALLALVGFDDTAAVYRTRDLSLLGTVSVGGPAPPGQERQTYPTPVAFSPDSHTLVVGDRFGRVRFFDATSLEPLGPPRQAAAYGDYVTELAYSPNGKSVVAVSTLEQGNGAYTVDVATGQRRGLEPPVGNPLVPSFSPDGRWLLVPSIEPTTVAYPVADGVPGPGHPISFPGAVGAAVAFSPNSRTVAMSTAQGAVDLFDAATLGTGVLRPLGPPIPVSPQILVNLIFSPDGRYLATLDLLSGIRLVDLSQRAVLGAPLPSVGREPFPAFSPDSRTLVIEGPTGSVLYDLDVNSWLARACQRAGRDLTNTEVTQYFSSAPHAYACAPGRPPVPPSG
jgi:DNA-binding SARP family transcriptional activator/WD40 repeat protein